MARMRAAVLGGAGVLVLALGVSGCGDKTTTSSTTLKFTEKDTNDFGFQDAAPTTRVGNQGPEKPSPGDQITFRSTLLDSSKKPAGELGATCTITGPGQTGFEQALATCAGTATVPGGTLALSAGGKTFGNNTVGTITGGTGKYARATGTFTSTSSGNGPNQDTYDITILKP